MESKKLNEKDKNFHPQFQVHCLDDVSFLQIGERIWRFLLRGNWGCIFFSSGVVVIDMRELSCLFIRFPPFLCAYSCRERMLLASIFASLPPLPYYSSLQRICQELGVVLRLLQSRTKLLAGQQLEIGSQSSSSSCQSSCCSSCQLF